MTTLGGRFIEEAAAPLQKGRQLAASGAATDALTAIRREVLATSLRAGVEQVAKLAARPALDVFRMLPMTEMEDELLAYEAVHAAAASLDELAEPLGAWQLRLERCGELLDAADDLRQGRAQRVFGRWAIVAALVGVGVGVGGLLVTRATGRARIDEVLASDDCAAAGVPESDRLHASASQLDALAQAERRCADARDAATQAERDREAEEEKRRVSEAAKAARDEACGALADAFAKGNFDAVDPELLGGQRERLARIVEGPLTLDDVQQDFAIPCAETTTGAAIRLSLARRVLEIIPRWIQVVVPSPVVRQALVEHKAALPIGELSLVAGHIDVMAKRAVKTGLASDVDHFAVLCKLAVDLVEQPKSNCAAVLELAR